MCVGNDLVADDAVGCAVHERLKTNLPATVRLELLGIGGLAFLDMLQGEEFLIVVDAVQLGAASGTVHVLVWDELPEARGAAVSLHGIGLREAISVGRILYPDLMPADIVLVGIEGRCFSDLGVGMSPPVTAAVEPAVATVSRLLQEHSRSTQSTRTD